MCKTVLNLLEAVYLRLRKIVVERVTVVKFRADNSDGSRMRRLNQASFVLLCLALFFAFLGCV